MSYIFRMNCQISKLAEICDYQASFSRFTLVDDNEVSDERQELKNNLLRDLRRCIEVEISKKKTAKDVNILQQKLNALACRKEDLLKKVEEKVKVKKLYDEKRALYEKVLNLYRKNLGFRMGTTKDDEDGSDITFVFNNISKKNPQQIFSISLMTDGVEYKVTDCQPAIDSLDELVMDLNNSNNLEKFIIQIRRKFCLISTMPNAK
ncbi:kinetochore protein Spc25 [Parasteatoda tepidariorum]|nr:kinetochore protein Spc25 [Parasteatoda tepidariorum]